MARIANLTLAGLIAAVLASCGVDYAGILSGKACDQTGACAGGYACDRTSWRCTPAGGQGATADGGPGGDAPSPEDTGEPIRDHGVAADDVPDAGPARDGGADASEDAHRDGALDAGVDGSTDTGADGSRDAGSDGGDGGGCTPTPHAGAICFNNDVYWVDSCGVTEEMKEDCAGAQVCFNAACCTPASCATLGKACGVWDDGCGGAVTCPPCDGAKLCLDGTCQTVIFVKGDATGNADGTSWTNAFTKVQDALDAAAGGDEVWIARGTYARRGAAAEVARLKDGVAVSGGFAGTETSLSARNLLGGNETVLKGESGVRVVVGASNATLDGITITGGDFMGGYGGGVYLSGNAGVKIANCLITGNAAHWGGGIYLSQSDADVMDTAISANTAVDGGGVFNQNATIRLTGDVVSGNVSQGNIGGGGGIFNDSAATTIVNCVFSGNDAQGSFAGAIYNNYTSTHTVTNCTFFGNLSHLGGGAIFNNITASPTITNSIFWNNSPDEIQDYPGYGSRAQVRYSDVRGGHAGDGNIDADPSFADAGKQDFRLNKGSPCIDAADGDIAPAADKDGAPRRDDPATADTGRGSPPYADIGAFEYAPH